MAQVKNHLRNLGWPLLCGGFTLGAVLLLYAIFGLAPFGSGSLASRQLLTLLAYDQDILAGRNSIAFTWSRGIGGTGFSLFSTFLASPFSLLSALFDKSHLGVCFNLIAALKLTFAAGTLRWYLEKRNPSLPAAAACALAVGYGLMHLGLAGGNGLLLDAAWLLPLILWGVCRLLTGDSFVPLAFFLGASVLFGWIGGIACCLMSFVAFIFLWSLSLLRRRGQGFRLRENLVLPWGRLLLGILLGLMLGMGILWPVLCDLRRHSLSLDLAPSLIRWGLCSVLYFCGIGLVQLWKERRVRMTLMCAALGLLALSGPAAVSSMERSTDLPASEGALFAALEDYDGGLYRVAGTDDALAFGLASTAPDEILPDPAQRELLHSLAQDREDSDGNLLAKDSLLGAKYILSRTPIPDLPAVENLPVPEDMILYENPFALPLAFAYSRDTAVSLPDAGSTPLNRIYSQLLGENVSMDPADPGTPEALRSLAAQGAASAAEIDLWPTVILCKLTAEPDQSLFLSLPDTEGWYVWVNGVFTETEPLGGFFSIPLPEGDVRVTLRYYAPGAMLGLILSLSGFFILLLYGGQILLRRSARPETVPRL